MPPSPMYSPTTLLCVHPQFCGIRFIAALAPHTPCSAASTPMAVQVHVMFSMRKMVRHQGSNRAMLSWIWTILFTDAEVLRWGCSFLDPRGLGALEGYTLQEAAQQLGAGDSQSPSWRPLRNYDGASCLRTIISDAGGLLQSKCFAAVSISSTRWAQLAVQCLDVTGCAWTPQHGNLNDMHQCDVTRCVQGLPTRAC